MSESDQFVRIEESTRELIKPVKEELIKSYYKQPSVSPDDSLTWSRQYSPELEQLLSRRSDLLSLFVEKPEEAIQEMERELYDKGMEKR